MLLRLPRAMMPTRYLCAGNEDNWGSNISIESSVNEWSPDARRMLNRLGYLDRSNDYEEIKNHPMAALARADGTTSAACLWASYLDDKTTLSPGELILLVEHFRRHPAASALALKKTRRRSYTKTLANASFRAANDVYEDAKTQLQRGDVDKAMCCFSVSLSEFLFAIDSGQLTDETLRIAYGKYATAVAFAGRWQTLSADIVQRAIAFSEQSYELGNARVETIVYRVELFLQAFDVSGDQTFLSRATLLRRTHSDLRAGTEMVQAEVRLRLALAADDPELRTIYLRNAVALLKAYTPTTPFDVVNQVALMTLGDAITQGFLPAPMALGIPNGLMSHLLGSGAHEMATVVWEIIERLRPLWRGENIVSAAIVSARLLRGLTRCAAGRSHPAYGRDYVAVTAWLSKIPSVDRHLVWEAGAAALDYARSIEGTTFAWDAYHRFEDLMRRYPSWALPRIGVARAIELLGAADCPDLPDLTGVWQEAASLAIGAPDYREESLGSRNSVFTVEDARGFMSDAFVFKPMTKKGATFEAGTLTTMARVIVEHDRGDAFSVPASLALITGGNLGEVVHVVQRAQGIEIGSLTTDEKSAVLGPTLELLSLFHLTMGPPEQGRSPWKALKAGLKLCLRSLVDPSESDELIELMKEALPSAASRI